MKATIELINQIYQASEIKASRNKLDVFSDRIRQASTEPTLLGFAERLQKLVDASPSKIEESVLICFMGEATASEAKPVLEWLRKFPAIAAMVAALKSKQDRAAALAGIELPKGAGRDGKAPVRRPFDIGIRVECLSPLAHGADSKSGNATLFRRMQVLSTTGDVLDLPFYAGNALRGILRDLLADHFLECLGLAPRRDNPPCELWFFHLLYAGGALEENSTAVKALQNMFGKAPGSLRTEGLRAFRDTLPGVSLLGCALGNRVLCGRVQVADLRPRCAQWGTGPHDAGELMEWTYLTRREDLESHGKDEHSGMIACTETLRAGVVLDGGIDCDGHIQPLERAALGRALTQLADRGRLGAENRRGHGSVRIEVENAPDPAPYDSYLAENKNAILAWLMEVNALACG